MDWLQTLDVNLFRFVSESLRNPVCDVLMPWLSGNKLFVPLVLLAVALFIWRGKTRGFLCVLMIAIVVGIGDGLVINKLKHAIGRHRPQVVLSGQPIDPATRGNSMPSAHAANWFAAAMVAFLYYRRSAWVFVPSAIAVSFSRVYNGAHFPSDVLVGAILGAGYAVAIPLAFDTAWQWIGRKWFPLWRKKLPSLLSPESRS